MSETDVTVVETELPDAEYERLRAIAEEEGVSIEAAVRRAVRAYAESKGWPDPDDPFFTFHERVDVEAAVEEPTDARDMDDDLYGETPE